MSLTEVVGVWIGLFRQIVDPHERSTVLICEGDRWGLSTQLTGTFAGHVTKLLIHRAKRVDALHTERYGARPETTN